MLHVLKDPPTSHHQRSSSQISPIHANSSSTYSTNLQKALPRHFDYGHCPLFLLLLLYFILFLTNLLTIFSMCFQEFLSSSHLSGQFLILFTYLIMIPYLLILLQITPTRPIIFGTTLPTPTSMSLVTKSPTPLLILSQSMLPLSPNINSSYPLGLSALSSGQPYIPRSIAAISKSPNPEKWTFALSNEIQSLISQNVFDSSPIDATSIPSHQIIPAK